MEFSYFHGIPGGFRLEGSSKLAQAPGQGSLPLAWLLPGLEWRLWQQHWTSTLTSCLTTLAKSENKPQSCQCIFQPMESMTPHFTTIPEAGSCCHTLPSLFWESFPTFLWFPHQTLPSESSWAQKAPAQMTPGCVDASSGKGVFLWLLFICFPWNVSKLRDHLSGWGAEQGVGRLCQFKALSRGK